MPTLKSLSNFLLNERFFKKAGGHGSKKYGGLCLNTYRP